MINSYYPPMVIDDGNGVASKNGSIAIITKGMNIILYIIPAKTKHFFNPEKYQVEI
jgi:hypothetical protein